MVGRCSHCTRDSRHAALTSARSPSLTRTAAAMRPVAGGHPHDTRFDRCSVSAAREVASSRYTFCSAVVKLKARATPSCIFDFVLCAGGEGVRICRARRRGVHRPKGHRAKRGSRHVTSVTPGVCKTRPSGVHGRARQELIGSGDPPRPLCSLQTAPLILCL